jgi:hypothetical protein
MYTSYEVHKIVHKKPDAHDLHMQSGWGYAGYRRFSLASPARLPSDYLLRATRFACGVLRELRSVPLPYEPYRELRSDSRL